MTERDYAILRDLYVASYQRSDQIAAGRFDKVNVTYRLRAAQRRLKTLAEHGVLRRIDQPVYRGEGTSPYIYAVGPAGAPLLASQLGVPSRGIDWRPRAREKNVSYLQHTLALVDYHLALKRGCIETGVSLGSWVTDHILQKKPDRVEITSLRGTNVTIGVVPDACYELGTAKRAATVLLEYDRATVTLEPGADSWVQKGWRRKVMGLLALADSGKLKRRYGTDSLFVTVVTKSQTRLENMVRTTEKAADDRALHFWFTTEDQLQQNILTAPIWRVAGMQGEHSVLPDHEPVLSEQTNDA